MRWTRILAGATCIWLGLLCVSLPNVRTAIEPVPNPPAPPPRLDAIRDLAGLTVTRVHATALAEGTVSGHTGSTTVKLLVHGSAELSVDLEQADFIRTDLDRKHLVLALPQPAVGLVAIDHKRTRVLSSGRDGLWRFALGAAREEQALGRALVVGKDRLHASVLCQEHTHRARQRAQAVVHGFAAEMGWTIEIRWED